jgi:hypothetical protein
MDANRPASTKTLPPILNLVTGLPQFVSITANISTSSVNNLTPFSSISDFDALSA